MPYATLADLRAEGVTEARADDARIALAVEEASALIDRVCGWYFEPRTQTLTVDGRGSSILPLPVPPIRVDALEFDGSAVSITTGDLVLEGAPVRARFIEPRLVLRFDAFPRGVANVSVTGLFGFTEEDGTTEGRTPLAIRRACLLLAIRILPKAATDAGREARDAWRILEERTRDQAVKFQPLVAGDLTGEPEVDRILTRYRRPAPMGAA